MTDDNRVLIAVLLDRSGSMSSIKTDTEGGFAAFIDEQRGVDRDVPSHVGAVRHRVRRGVRRACAHRGAAGWRWIRAAGRRSMTHVGRLVSDVGAELAAQAGGGASRHRDRRRADRRT